MNIIRQPDPFRYGYRYVARTDAAAGRRSS